MNFDYGTVRTTVQQIFGSDQDVGRGISDMLVEKLVNGGQYSVIERNELDKILKEQNFSNSDRADANSAAKIGAVLGLDAIIIGRSRNSAVMTSTPTSAVGGVWPWKVRLGRRGKPANQRQWWPSAPG